MQRHPISQLALLLNLLALSSAAAPGRFDLTSFVITSSANVTGDGGGARISEPSYVPSSPAWLNCSVPATIMACLIQNNEYPDVFFGRNLFAIDASRFDIGITWWYRSAAFTLPIDTKQGDTVQLSFKGINYRANVWVNGVIIASNATIVGTFRYFDFDISSVVNLGGAANVVAVEVTRPFNPGLDGDNGTDLAITFVDWAPQAPDWQGGLIDDVTISVTGPLSLKFPLVNTTLQTGGAAALDFVVEVTNHATVSVTGAITAVMLAPSGPVLVNVSQSVAFAPNSSTQVVFAHTQFPSLVLLNPTLWWPLQMGTPALHTFSASVAVVGAASDSVSVSVGLRQMSSTIDGKGHLQLHVNGVPILIRGGGWAPDLFLRSPAERLDAELAYVLDMGLNAIRLEGKFVGEAFFNECDRRGILTLPGICCCDSWQRWSQWTNESYTVAGESMRSQFGRLKAHASIVGFFTSSDQLPPQKVEQLYLNMARSEHFPNPLIAAASAATSKISGPTGVKMSGPYSWVAPSYWLVGGDSAEVGGAFGFLTEGGPGESPMAMESVLATVPSNDLFPPAPDDCWMHCGYKSGNFWMLSRFNSALYKRYWQCNTSTATYLGVSQMQVYEGMRAFFEGYTRNKHTGATGTIQWMLNSAWPSNVWHTYDYYLNPDASYAGTRAACAPPLHAMYSYDDSSVWLINSAFKDVATTGYAVTAKIFLFNGTLFESASAGPGPVVGSDAAVRIMNVSTPAAMRTRLGQGKVYFLRLTVTDAAGKVLDTNEYWLSTTAEVIDWKSSTWYNTGCSAYADYSELRGLTPVKLAVSSVQVDQNSTAVTISAPPDAMNVAFFVRARLLDAPGGSDVLPITWDRNYVVLMFPGESVTLMARYNGAQLSAAPVAAVSTMNDVLVPATHSLLGPSSYD